MKVYNRASSKPHFRVDLGLLKEGGGGGGLFKFHTYFLQEFIHSYYEIPKV